jgi:hypothetical protein
MAFPQFIQSVTSRAAQGYRNLLRPGEKTSRRSSESQVPASTHGRVRLWNIDRLLYRLYPSLLDAIIIVQPETVIRWPPENAAAKRRPCF